MLPACQAPRVTECVPPPFSQCPPFTLCLQPPPLPQPLTAWRGIPARLFPEPRGWGGGVVVLMGPYGAQSSGTLRAVPTGDPLCLLPPRRATPVPKVLTALLAKMVSAV